MIWEDPKLVFVALGQTTWLCSHASSSAVEWIKDGEVCLLLTGRDNQNKSRIGRFIYNLKNDLIVDISSNPVIELGILGSFDEYGTSYPALANGNLFYTGWSKGNSVPFYNQLGLAEINGNEYYERKQRLPIFINGDNESIGVGSVFPFISGDEFFLFYTSFKSWNLDEPEKHIYTTSLANISEINNNLIFKKHSIFRSDTKKINQSKCAIINLNNIYIAWVCIKYSPSNYKIVCYESTDLLNWQASPDLDLHFNNLPSWCNESQSYPNIFLYDDKIYMFFAGNEYGNKGFGITSILKKVI